jgi:ribonuclease-3
MSGQKKALGDLLRARDPDVNRIIGTFVAVYNPASRNSPAPCWDVSPEEWYRFAFLGDRVLNLIISQALFTRRGAVLNKGRMTKALSGIVSNESLDAFIVRSGISIDPLVPASVDTQKKRGQRITGTAFEALIGALYCELGPDDVACFITSLFAGEICRVDTIPNAKGDLQEYFHRQKKPSPDYSRITRSGSDHEPAFACHVTLHDGRVFTGTGLTKKEAQQAAARAALDVIQKEKD